MRIGIAPRGGYLHAELQGRENARDMREFLHRVKEACLEHACPRILISIRSSNTMFRAEDYGLSGYVNEIVTPTCRIALVGDSSELNHAHEYIELVARQQHVNVRAFRDQASAVRWLEAADPVGPELDALKPGGAPKLA